MHIYKNTICAYTNHAPNTLSLIRYHKKKKKIKDYEIRKSCSLVMGAARGGGAEADDVQRALLGPERAVAGPGMEGRTFALTHLGPMENPYETAISPR